MIQCQCPRCQHHIQATPDFAGRPGVCPSCKQEFIFPQAAAPPVATQHQPVQTVVVQHQLHHQGPPMPATGWFARAFGAGLGWTAGTMFAVGVMMFLLCGGGIFLAFFCAGMPAWW